MTKLEGWLSALFSAIGNPLTRDVSTHFKPEVIIVLGTSINKDGSPSFGLTRRLQTAVALATSWGIEKIILSGGRNHTGRTEAEIMLETIRDSFPPSTSSFDLILEGESRNTHENAKYSTKVMKKLGISTGLVITSPYHVGRASKEFASFGLPITVIAAFDPSEYPLKSHVKALSHEYLALLVYSLRKLPSALRR